MGRVAYRPDLVLPGDTPARSSKPLTQPDRAGRRARSRRGRTASVLRPSRVQAERGRRSPPSRTAIVAGDQSSGTLRDTAGHDAERLTCFWFPERAT